MVGKVSNPGLPECEVVVLTIDDMVVSVMKESK
jgi:hypothetical protein